jgi:hypothetical protein
MKINLCTLHSRMRFAIVLKCVQLGSDFPSLRVYKPYFSFFDKNLPSKIGVRLIHEILCPFDD